MSIFQNIQFGVDIATSVTILGAAASWLFNQHRVRKEEERRREQDRQRGINDAARAVVVESINGVIKELSRDFNQILADGIYIQDRVDRAMKNGGRDFLIRMVEKKKIDFELMEKKLDLFRGWLGSFYEYAALSRYLLIPSLYSLPEGEDAIAKLNGDVKGIMEACNRIIDGPVQLKTNLKPLLEVARAVDEEERKAPDHLDKFCKEHFSTLYQFAVNEDNSLFMSTVMPSDHKEAFKNYVQTKMSSDEPDNKVELKLVSSVILHLAENLVSSPSTAEAFVIVCAAYEAQLATTKCKEFLVNLSAIACRVQSKENSPPIASIAKDLQSEKYFDLETGLR